MLTQEELMTIVTENLQLQTFELNDNTENITWENWGKLHDIAIQKKEAKIFSKWNNLSKQDQMDFFYAVIKKLTNSEINQKGSYRYTLYDEFGFDSSAYSMGMDCGYMTLHNSIYSHQNIQSILKDFCNTINVDPSTVDDYIKITTR